MLNIAEYISLKAATISDYHSIQKHNIRNSIPIDVLINFNHYIYKTNLQMALKFIC
jgi:hypothetical protein